MATYVFVFLVMLHHVHLRFELAYHLRPRHGPSGYYIPGVSDMLFAHSPLVHIVYGHVNGELSPGLIFIMVPLVLVLAGTLLGYHYRRKSLRANVGLSVWLAVGYVVPLTLLGTISLVMDFARFSPNIWVILIIVLYGIGLSLLFGTWGIVLSDRIFDSNPT